ncbi:hypothetical protein [Gordonia sputi]|uniref:Uncharacterized protein n=1 Tax=Gordonia sputi NBRC 100414 TaxID=1089453 RepID=H5U6B8_9ACTN|nr:hypothetical protein [Gordonia sputi]GAB41276.1 hypothetical protein GOSPT_125_00430 [Gordonia sputi NBRC 100414]
MTRKARSWVRRAAVAAAITVCTAISATPADAHAAVSALTIAQPGGTGKYGAAALTRSARARPTTIL